MPFHSQLYAMFNLKHCMPPHWEYNAQNEPNYEKKWGTNLVWKWWHGLHALDFAASFVNFEKKHYHGDYNLPCLIPEPK
jgi:hypothetical protein